MKQLSMLPVLDQLVRAQLRAQLRAQQVEPKGEALVMGEELLRQGFEPKAAARLARVLTRQF